MKKKTPMKQRFGEQSEHQTMIEQGKLRDAHLRAQEQPLAWAAWEIKHHPRQHNVRSWSIQALRAGGYVVDGAARRVRGGDGLPGGWITPIVLTQKGEKLASTWSAAKSKALEAKWAKAKKAFEQSLEAAAHARSIRSAMGDEALAFARAEQAAEPGAFWDEVVRVLKKSAGQPERHENPARTVLPRKGPWYAGHAKKLDVFDAAYVGKGNDALGQPRAREDEPPRGVGRRVGRVGHPSGMTPSPKMPLSMSFIQKAEEYVRQHPEGVRTRAVAEEIGQGLLITDSTLRMLLSYGRIRREKREMEEVWLPPMSN